MNTTVMIVANRETIPLVELIVVIVIFGLLAAMAIPRFSQAASSDNASDLRADLVVLRTAIELYYQDHGAYPGQRGTGVFGADAGTAAAFFRQLTQYTDADGQTASAPSARFCYGPYLCRDIPRCPVAPGGQSAQVHVIRGSTPPAYDPTAQTGWVYNLDTAYITANSAGIDAAGVRYDRY